MVIMYCHYSVSYHYLSIYVCLKILREQLVIHCQLLDYLKIMFFIIGVKELSLSSTVTELKLSDNQLVDIVNVSHRITSHKI